MARISGPVRDRPGPYSAATGCDHRVPGVVDGPRTQRVRDGATVTGRPRRLGSRLHGTAASVRDGMTATRASVAPVGLSAASSAARDAAVARSSIGAIGDPVATIARPRRSRRSLVTSRATSAHGAGGAGQDRPVGEHDGPQPVAHLEELDDRRGAVGSRGPRLVGVDRPGRAPRRLGDGEAPLALRHLLLEGGDAHRQPVGGLGVAVGREVAQPAQLAGPRGDLGVAGSRHRVDAVRDRPPPLDAREDAVVVARGQRPVDVEGREASAVEREGRPHVEARGLELVGGEQAVAGGDAPLRIDLPPARVVEPGPDEDVVEPVRERLPVRSGQRREPTVGAVGVVEEEPGLRLEPDGPAVGRRRGCADGVDRVVAARELLHDPREVVAGGRRRWSTG